MRVSDEGSFVLPLDSPLCEFNSFDREKINASTTTVVGFSGLFLKTKKSQSTSSLLES